MGYGAWVIGNGKEGGRVYKNTVNEKIEFRIASTLSTTPPKTLMGYTLCKCMTNLTKNLNANNNNNPTQGGHHPMLLTNPTERQAHAPIPRSQCKSHPPLSWQLNLRYGRCE